MSKIKPGLKVVISSLFTEKIKVFSQAGHYREDGKWVLEDQEPKEIWGIVQPSTPNEIEFLPEGERSGEYITVHSKETISITRLRGTPDQIEWHGQKYKIVKASQWLDYGYFETVCSRISKVEA